MSNLLGGWTPKDTASQLAKLTRYSSFVSFSKYGLVLLAAGLVAVVFVIPAFHDTESGARLVFTNIQVGESMKPRMVSPKFQGMDDKQQPYRLNAEYAEPLDGGSIFLHKIDADITLAKGEWLAVLADEGIYNAKAKTLRLTKTYNIFHDKGYEVRASETQVDLAKSTAVSQKQVELQGAFGSLKADGFELFAAEKRAVFAPNVSMRLYTNKK
ncbi:MAG: hypothetical protein FJX23_07185 [Alphaproteobacteria bacterium]|nr:hypothetical protein [Alphaproteobacteria bacterium]